MLDYKLDLMADSYYHIVTPDDTARSFSFYVTEFGRYRAGREYYTTRDGKNAALLMFTLSGKGEMEWKGQNCTLAPGSAVVINCDTRHHYRTVSEEPWDFYWVHFNIDGPEGFRKALTEHLTPVLLTDPNGMHELFGALEATRRTDGILAWAEMSQAVSGMLLTMMRSLANPENAQPLRRDEVIRLAEFIRENLEKPLCMEDFMRLTNLSRFHLIRLFRQQMGVPPYQYLHNCRINRAQQLLRTTNLTVSEVARHVGYGDPVNFIRHFKKLVGTTPSRYGTESVQLP